MYNKCPKCGYERQSHDDPDSDVCPSCGIIFSRFVQQQAASEDFKREKVVRDESDRREKGLLLAPGADISTTGWIGRILLWILFSAWGLYFIFLDVNSNQILASFMHKVDLVFHNLGHLVFKPFGEFMAILGATLLQLLLPLVFVLAFIFKARDNFVASLCLWWLAQNMMDIAPYVADAGKMALGVSAGAMSCAGKHDWNQLMQIGLFENEKAVATFFDVGGELLMWVAIFWGLLVLLKQRRALVD